MNRYVTEQSEKVHPHTMSQMRVQECQWSQSSSSATIFGLLALQISSHSLKFLDVSKKTYRYLMQPLPLSRKVFYALSLLCDMLYEFSHISDHIYNSLLENRTIFPIEHQVPQGFSPLLPYYRIQFLLAYFLKTFPLFSQSSFARKKIEDFCWTLCFLQPEVLTTRDSAFIRVSYMLSGVNRSLLPASLSRFYSEFYSEPESLIQDQKCFYHSFEIQLKNILGTPEHHYINSSLTPFGKMVDKGNKTSGCLFIP